MFCVTVSHGNSVYVWNTIPRSAPGARTTCPSRRTSPLVGVSSPATMRSSVLLPHPDGPRIVMKSLCATSSDVGSSACVGGPPRTPGNVRDTPTMVRWLIARPRPRPACALPARDDRRVGLAAIARRRGYGARLGLWLRPPRSCQRPREQTLVAPFEQEVGHEADQPDQDDAEDDLAGV